MGTPFDILPAGPRLYGDPRAERFLVLSPADRLSPHGLRRRAVRAFSAMDGVAVLDPGARIDLYDCAAELAERILEARGELARGRGAAEVSVDYGLCYLGGGRGGAQRLVQGLFRELPWDQQPSTVVALRDPHCVGDLNVLSATPPGVYTVDERMRIADPGAIIDAVARGDAAMAWQRSSVDRIRASLGGSHSHSARTREVLTTLLRAMEVGDSPRPPVRGVLTSGGAVTGALVGVGALAAPAAVYVDLPSTDTAGFTVDTMAAMRGDHLTEESLLPELLPRSAAVQAVGRLDATSVRKALIAGPWAASRPTFALNPLDARSADLALKIAAAMADDRAGPPVCVRLPRDATRGQRDTVAQLGLSTWESPGELPVAGTLPEARPAVRTSAGSWARRWPESRRVDRPSGVAFRTRS